MPARTKARPSPNATRCCTRRSRVGGETKKYYRFQTPDDGVVDYYDETGKSAKKFLVRKPVNNAIMRSGFGGRRHPILGYVKMHTGVDWATAYGTPIFASGNGVVEKVGLEGGYGKYIRIKHNNGYETAYGHMSAFAKGMEAGKRVRQGQVIGFVGSTGLSTGPHVHYEILVNGRFVDPDAHQAAARPLAGRHDHDGLREGARPARRHDERSRRAHLGCQRRTAAGDQPLIRSSLTSGKQPSLRCREGFSFLLVSGSVQLALRDRRLELRDLRGRCRLAVEGQHIALAARSRPCRRP